jgi:hypothetical protein
VTFRLREEDPLRDTVYVVDMPPKVLDQLRLIPQLWDAPPKREEFKCPDPGWFGVRVAHTKMNDRSPAHLIDLYVVDPGGGSYYIVTMNKRLWQLLNEKGFGGGTLGYSPGNKEGFSPGVVAQEKVPSTFCYRYQVKEGVVRKGTNIIRYMCGYCHNEMMSREHEPFCPNCGLRFTNEVRELQP